MNSVIVNIGQVESLVDNADGMRLKVRLEQDRGLNNDELPYSFPLLPKTIQTAPKVGEAVLVITSILNNKNSIRYYVGPLISQPQFMYEDAYEYGIGNATSLLQGNYTNEKEAVSRYYGSQGAFPKVNDVALVGRKTEDIILKDDEIDIRCGIRTKAIGENDNISGYVFMNTLNPSYIQLKFKNGIGRREKQEADSVINMVADKINLISHKDTNHFMLTDQEELIKSSDLDEIMSKLHQVPYGDVLVDVLKKIVNALVLHVHPYPGLAPCVEENITKVIGIDFDKLLSPNVRIS